MTRHARGSMRSARATAAAAARWRIAGGPPPALTGEAPGAKPGGVGVRASGAGRRARAREPGAAEFALAEAQPSAREVARGAAGAKRGSTDSPGLFIAVAVLRCQSQIKGYLPRELHWTSMPSNTFRLSFGRLVISSQLVLRWRAEYYLTFCHRRGPYAAADIRNFCWQCPGLARGRQAHQTRGVVTVLIDPESSHPGAGSCVVDGAYSEQFLRRLEALFERLPASEPTKDSPNARSYFCDMEGWLQRELAEPLGLAGPTRPPVEEAMPQARFLHYQRPGGALPPHVDLARTGGETVLLDRQDDAPDAVLAEVRPRRGRLLLFPHRCPHLARPTVEVPKLLLRGEMFGPRPAGPAAAAAVGAYPGGTILPGIS
ncbi:unnamed protein product [Prorocentrum cordatum]|uniref:Prolyl 4-hydroxylase alpha subunit domain-containing protein n=1 Tax=Prorocentrum cordatum TaxID=2364126 RepID=A0ABN9PK87_9DINO|nr:unnamed protein product [Polarella glacialis]